MRQTARNTNMSMPLSPLLLRTMGEQLGFPHLVVETAPVRGRGPLQQSPAQRAGLEGSPLPVFLAPATPCTHPHTMESLHTGHITRTHAPQDLSALRQRGGDLAASWDMATVQAWSEGSGRTLVLTGSPGEGKSTLAAGLITTPGLVQVRAFLQLWRGVLAW